MTESISVDADASKNGKLPSVSVIVPVFNCESYVVECLESLKNQTLGDFEVIVVDDASTDSSLERAVACIGDDGRFTVLPQQCNRGLSAVRNVGLDHASGEYVVFLDSDDYLRLDALELLVTRAREQQLDDLYFGGRSFYEELSLAKKHVEDFDSRDDFEGVATGRELYAFFVERDQFFTSAALRMVRREFVEEEGIRFVEGMLHEDILFTFLTVAASRRSSFLNEPLYQRRFRAGSIMVQPWTWKNMLGHFMSMLAIRQWMVAHASSVDARFAVAVGKTLAGWQRVCAEKWASDFDEVHRQAFLDALPSKERVSFLTDVVGVGGEAARIRGEFLDSPAYRLGDALVKGPRAAKTALKAMRSARDARRS